MARALPIALAPLITDGPIIALMILVLIQLPDWMARALPIGGGFYVAMIGTLAASIVLIGAARRLGARFNRALLGISAIVLAGFGLYQLWNGLAG